MSLSLGITIAFFGGFVLGALVDWLRRGPAGGDDGHDAGDGCCGADGCGCGEA